MADQLRTFVVGKRLFQTTVLEGRYKKQSLDGIEEIPPEIEVHDVQAKGKFLYWAFSGDWSLWATMGMSGGWRKVSLGVNDHEFFSQKHDAVRFHLRQTINDENTNSYVFFNDSRRFGTLKFVKGKDVLEAKLASLGFDPFVNLPSENVFARLHSRKFNDKTIGASLMDQSLFCGVGNYIRAEALYASKLDPFRRSGSLTRLEVGVLCRHVSEIMHNSYNSNGATILTYKDTNGHVGSYSSKFAVYGRKQAICGHVVQRQDTEDKRTIHWCPTCQK